VYNVHSAYLDDYGQQGCQIYPDDDGGGSVCDDDGGDHDPGSND